MFLKTQFHSRGRESWIHTEELCLIPLQTAGAVLLVAEFSAGCTVDELAADDVRIVLATFTTRIVRTTRVALGRSLGLHRLRLG